MYRVSFQGERGAYSESAAHSFFDVNIETVPLPTFHDVINSTEKDKTNFSIIPVENSIEGSVGESYDLLYSTTLNVIGEVYHRIKHCLIGIGTLDKIDIVYSHPQALGQCRKFIQGHKLRTVPTYDTAGSVLVVKEINQENVACIASKSASEINKVPIIKEGIEDNPNNFTRFLILSKKEAEKTDNDKTSIIFSIKHEPGSLYKIIEKFQKLGVNLTKIESRPIKGTPWEYNFSLDFEGNRNNPKIKEILDEIKNNSLYLKILGSYPSAKIN